MTYAYEYYDAQKVEHFRHYEVPKVLIEDDSYGLGSDEVLLYAIMHDRMSLSKKNNWVDDEGHVYIIMTPPEIAKLFHCCEDTAAKIRNKLESRGLIRRKRRGQGKKDIIYVMDYATRIDSDSRTRKNRDQESEEIGNPNNIYNNNKNSISIDPNISDTNSSSNDDVTIIDRIELANDDISYHEPNEYVRQAIRYIYDHKNNNTLMSYHGQSVPIDQIRDRFRGLGPDHARYAIERCRSRLSQGASIWAPIPYMISALLQALDDAGSGSAGSSPPKKNKFCDFKQRNYDFSALEKEAYGGG